ncbi:hypothetical protein OSB04_027963 [Centaurea solstitialis]|uniref:Uncharacterized protein n=1 Tax=Centaurea solstitialis TaxID=347529 RepID=A0AA38W066_9ASTR|nr:hypothetical protein OSB04_027963 [Centaurea solstitialis]
MKEPKKKMISFHLNSNIAVWWDKVAVQHQRQRRGILRPWQRMKQLMIEIYPECSLGTRTVADCNTEFLYPSKQNEIRKTKG